MYLEKNEFNKNKKNIPFKLNETKLLQNSCKVEPHWKL